MNQTIEQTLRAEIETKPEMIGVLYLATRDKETGDIQVHHYDAPDMVVAHVAEKLDGDEDDTKASTVIYSHGLSKLALIASLENIAAGMNIPLVLAAAVADKLGLKREIEEL